MTTDHSESRLRCPICYDVLDDGETGQQQATSATSEKTKTQEFENGDIEFPSISATSSPISTSSNIFSFSLKRCGHIFCKKCIEEWFLHIEKSERGKTIFRCSQALLPPPPLPRQDEQSTPHTNITATNDNDDLILPKCPQCRLPVTSSDVRSVLGRNIEAVKVEDMSEAEYLGILTARLMEESELEAFTLATLQQEDARQCPECHMWIIRDDGCDAMMCLCGCRFCFCCGKKGSCSTERSLFYDNILQQEEEGDGFLWDSDDEEWLEYVYRPAHTAKVYALFMPDGQWHYKDYWDGYGYYWNYSANCYEKGEKADMNIIPFFGGSPDDYDQTWYQIWCGE